MVRRYEGLGREEAQALSIALSRETMRAIRAHVDGFYLITPFGRVKIIAALLATAGENRGTRRCKIMEACEIILTNATKSALIDKSAPLVPFTCGARLCHLATGEKLQKEGACR